MKVWGKSFVMAACFALIAASAAFGQGQADPPRPWADIENDAIRHVLTIGDALARDGTDGVRSEAQALLALKEDVERLLGTPEKKRGPVPRAFAPAMAGLIRAAEPLAQPAYGCPGHTRQPSRRPGACPVCREDMQELPPDLKVSRSAYGALAQAGLAFLKDETLKAELVPEPRVFYCPMVKLPWLQSGEDVANPYMGSSMGMCGQPAGPDGRPLPEDDSNQGQGGHQGHGGHKGHH